MDVAAKNRTVLLRIVLMLLALTGGSDYSRGAVSLWSLALIILLVDIRRMASYFRAWAGNGGNHVAASDG
jgi:hypothetical protein